MGFDVISSAKLFVKAESSYAQVAAVPVAGDAIRFFNLQGGVVGQPAQANVAGQGRSQVKANPGRRRTRMTLETPIITVGNGNVGAAAELSPLLVAGLGRETLTASTDATYDLTPDTVMPFSMFLDTNETQDCFKGCVIESISCSWSGQSFTRMAFTIAGQSVARLINFDGEVEASDLDLIAPVGTGVDARNFGGVGNVLKFGTGAATIVEEAAATGLTVADDQVASANQDVTSGLPTPAFASDGPSHYGTLGLLSLDGGTTEVMHLNGSIQYVTGQSLVDGEYGTSVPRGAISPARRTIQCSLTMAAETSAIERLAAIERNVSYDTIVQHGVDAGDIVQWLLEEVTFSPSAITRRDNDVSIITLQGIGSALAADTELEMVYK